MFNPQPDLTALRQGDIIRGLYHPLWKISDVPILGSIAGGAPPDSGEILLHAKLENKKYVQGLVKLTPTLAIVVSQCCDVEAREGKIEAPSFVLAPLEPVRSLRFAQNEAEMLKLKQNNIRNYTNFFYVEPTDPISESSYINFNRVFSIHKDDYGYVLGNKVLQMTDENRIAFKVKLSNHFGRPTEDEMSAGLYPPKTV